MTPVAAFLAVTLLVVSAAALGSRVASTRTLPRISRGDATDAYTRDAIGPLAPVSAQYTRQRLGPFALQQTTTRTTVPPTLPPPSNVAAPRNDSIKGSPGTFPSLAPGGWVLTLSMVSDRDTVRVGEQIRYRMLVGNTGSDEFRGRSFTLEWHTPSGTFGRNALNQCSLLFISLLHAACTAQRIVLSPGFGDASHESFRSSGLVAVDPGEQFVHEWYVQVLPSAVGTTLVNHAHLTVRIDGRDHTIRSGDVVVTVVA